MYAANRASDIQLLMLILDFMVNSMLKILKSISVECIECLDEDAKKKGKPYILRNRDDQITASAKLLDITHKSYGFSGDVIEIIN